ncbi:MAG: phosphomethylpyrimidine synthase ThiC [Candidatus Tectomicrobia bacterium]|uniref:Phosphomethylpyrimidine synthase n=1 Tax=Tectimicrobiota bacterium TaxID=2528274 RepID=A0A932FX92_UNCTE|nr:phosphomethylpyrimidine synthase ThiC [Candidatus Tectomicrobia bacterium]
MTQAAKARQGILTEAMEQVARVEGSSPEAIREGLARGEIVITLNCKRPKAIQPLGIGKGLCTKTNANIGTSKDHVDLEFELEKLEVAIRAGADTIMDLSTGGPLDEIRQAIIARSTIPVGTVPIYQAAVAKVRQGRSMVEMTAEEMFRSICQHVEDGVDFITVHCGVTRESVSRLKQEGRLLGVVSRGGAFLVEWMEHNGKENPLYERYDELLEIARTYDVTLSLGDGLRPGCLADATDRGQVQETLVLGELVDRARAAGVQAMVEGPGHVPLHQIQANVLLQKRLCHGAPFYVLGPLVTDIAPGYDHITGAIGGALAAAAGADYLCYVTPSEHLRLPTLEDVKEGVVAAKIAAHAADIAKGIPGAMERDIRMAQLRKELNWEGQIQMAIDPERPRQFRAASPPQDEEVCTMCGEFCAIKVQNRG